MQQLGVAGKLGEVSETLAAASCDKKRKGVGGDDEEEEHEFGFLQRRE